MSSRSRTRFHRSRARVSISGSGSPERCRALRVRGFATGTRLNGCSGCGCASGCKGCSWTDWRLGISISRVRAGALRVLRFPRRLCRQMGQAPALVNSHFSKHFKWNACGRQPDFSSEDGVAPQGRQRISSSATISTIQMEHSALSGSSSQSSSTAEPLAKNELRTLCNSWDDSGSTGSAACDALDADSSTAASLRRWRINCAMAWRLRCSWYQAGSGSRGSLAHGLACAAISLAWKIMKFKVPQEKSSGSRCLHQWILTSNTWNS